MPEGAPEPLGQVRAATDAIRALLQDSLLGIYLHGSAVAGGLRPQSDIDLLAVIDAPMTAAQSRSLLSTLLQISGPHPAPPGGPRCIEVMVFQSPELVAPDFPARAEFMYGEWLRQAFEAGGLAVPAADPEHTLILAQARGQAIPLIGPDATELIPEIPPEQVRRAMREALPALVEGLHGDERNVLLTLARMWRTATTGDFVAKDVAATWATTRMPSPEAGTLDYAREAYLGSRADDWATRQAEAGLAATFLRQRIAELL
ncbi:aminoglycoside nucleotidyltransferase ANT9 [Kaistia granuli]|uniref:aminoglycoside nucleotidyltransferase ANT9 n=1 Tax=Kaistia granuli TaxID=363259 RepID=UPI000363F09D|nr:aminoglycoside nucleotidyltransferase ANT9 [Kaistia granuli]